MKVLTTISALRRSLPDEKGAVIGLVPTMGYLHDGHLSLIETARRECDCVVVSVFVNPLQFGPREDFDTYPRDLNRDKAQAEKAGADLLFAPDTEEMYPKPPFTTVRVSNVTEGMCGASRPGHFDGVATVVTKLFHIVQPHRAYFGLKDVQQVAVIQRMVDDLNIPVNIVPCPTVREPDGLAMSSRNVYLSEEERRQATVLFQALKTAKEKLAKREWHTPQQVEDGVRDIIETQPLADIDYVEMRTFPDLERVRDIGNKTYVIAVAVKFGKTRLIDNILFQGGETPTDVAYDDDGETAQSDGHRSESTLRRQRHN
jgi:pantoate--beta-alanine ligase